MLMCTEATLALYPYGFIEKVYGLLCATKEERILEIRTEIEKDETWIKSIKEKVIQNKRNIKEQINADAEYMYEEEQKKVNEKLKSKMNNPVAVIIEEIKKNTDWYKDIVKKANMNGVAIEVQLKKDAEYILQQRGL